MVDTTGIPLIRVRVKQYQSAPRSSQRYREAVSASQEEGEDNDAGEETPAQVRRKLEEEIKELTEKRENALEESGRLLELYLG